MKSSVPKIVLNFLPPALPQYPSISLSVLKNFLHRRHIPVEIKYWNLLFTEALDDLNKYEGMDADIKALLPFFNIIAHSENDSRAQKRIGSLLKSYGPFVDTGLDKTCEKILDLIRCEIDKTDFSNVILFGISSKFYQWAPGMILLQELKKKHPHIKTIAGGFPNSESAVEILNICGDIDFATWGEGEYPLLDLYERLRAGNTVYEKVPRMVYRHKNKLIVSEAKGDFAAFDNYAAPGYDDYLAQVKNLKAENIVYPVESSRGCSWNRCKFCISSQGYRYRERSPQSIVSEMEFLFTNYGAVQFSFMDSNITGRNMDRFGLLLDLLIEASQTNECKWSITAEVIPLELDAGLIKKMSLAGFANIQIGYEALSDSLLKKMNKCSSFAHNLLLVKFGLKYHVRLIGANLLTGIPAETEDDLAESMENIHFLRFFVSESKFTHTINKLRIHNGSIYYRQLGQELKNEWNYNSFAYYLPGKYSQGESRFNLFGFSRETPFKEEWEKLERMDLAYRKEKYCYKLISCNGTIIYEEYRGDTTIKTIPFNKPMFWDTLIAANNKVICLDELYTTLKIKFKNITSAQIKKILAELKTESLLYHNADFSNIVSVIDTDTLV